VPRRNEAFSSLLPVGNLRRMLREPLNGWSAEPVQ
jgi:hypothetical protein